MALTKLKPLSAFLLFAILLTILVVPLGKEENVSAATSDYDSVVTMPNGVEVYIFYSTNWTDSEKEIINENLTNILPFYFDEFWELKLTLNITIVKNTGTTSYGTGSTQYENGLIVGYEGIIWISEAPGPLAHELTHVFQLTIPNYWNVISNGVGTFNLMGEAVANAFARVVRSRTSVDSDLNYRGQLIDPQLTGYAGYMYGLINGGYRLMDGWERLWYHDNQVFKKFNEFVAKSSTSITLRSCMQQFLSDNYSQYAFDGLSIDNWLDAFYFANLADIPVDTKLIFWEGRYWDLNLASKNGTVDFEGQVLVKQANGTISQIPISNYDITISDSFTKEVLFSAANLPSNSIPARIDFYQQGFIPLRNLLRVDCTAHLLQGDSVNVTAYLVQARNNKYLFNGQYDERFLFFLNKEGYAEGSGTSNVGIITDGFICWNATDNVVANVTWQNHNYQYVISNILANPWQVTQAAIRLYESRIYLVPTTQITNHTRDAILEVYLSPIVSTGKIELYESSDAIEWTKFSEEIPTKGMASFDISVPQLGFFMASWTGDSIISPSNSSILKIDFTPTPSPTQTPTPTHTPTPTASPTTTPTEQSTNNPISSPTVTSDQTTDPAPSVSVPEISPLILLLGIIFASILIVELKKRNAR